MRNNVLTYVVTFFVIVAALAAIDVAIMATTQWLGGNPARVLFAICILLTAVATVSYFEEGPRK